MADYSAATAVDDLVLLSRPGNETIMETLKKRLERGSIYTYIGHVLIAMNPYRMLDIYSDKQISLVSGCWDSCGGKRTEKTRKKKARFGVVGWNVGWEMFFWARVVEFHFVMINEMLDLCVCVCVCV